jgi:hypothetical protein
MYDEKARPSRGKNEVKGIHKMPEYIRVATMTPLSYPDQPSLNEKELGSASVF